MAKRNVKYGNHRYSGLIVPVLLLLLYSCHPTRKVPADAYLLDKNIVTVNNNKEINKSELARLSKQIPNNRIAGFRFHLWLYNIARDNKTNRVNRYLKKVGEEPVIYDPVLRHRSAQQMLLYLQSIGYYNALVQDTVLFKGRHATTYFTIDPNVPYKISRISYKIEDSVLVPFVLPDTIHSLLRKGDRFDLNQMQNERTRIETMLKNQGFYNFNKEYIYFEADSSLSRHQVEITLGITKYIYRDSVNILHTINHRRYYIRNVFVIPQYNPVALDTIKTLDTLVIDSLDFLMYGPVKVNPHVIAHSTIIQPNKHFNLADVDETYKKLSLLRNFKFINIIFKEDVNHMGHNGDYSLDCYVQLSPYLSQSYTTELEGTNNNGNFGAAVNLLYQHKNLFKRAVIFDFKIRGAYEALRKKKPDPVLYNTFEYGAEGRLSIPQFLLPFRGETFTKKYSPKTTIGISYNYQKRPDYFRTIANATFGYNWKGSPFTTYYINPVEINYVMPTITDSGFQKMIDTSFLKYSYQKLFINSFTASYIFSNQTTKNTRSYYLSLRGETAGVILESMHKWTNRPMHNGVYEFMGTDFAQYVKADLDMRLYTPINSHDKLVYRLFAGVGVPYNNSKSMPFVRRYFGGGPSSLRGWQIRTLGPGSAAAPVQYSFPNQTGDMKLEGNIEYRFKLLDKLEGAMFVDAGNIWNINEDDPAGSQFHIGKFYNQIAVGSGLGLRFDFSFFIFRFDMGFKTRDPAAEKGKRWVFGSGDFNRNDVNYFIAIGYPF